MFEPDPDDPDCAVPLVDAVAGGRTRRFVLDTGARTSQLADGSGLEVVGRTETSGVFAAYEVDVVRAEIALFGRRTLDVHLGDRDLLAMDYLQAFALRLDPAAATLEPGATGADLPLALSDGHHPFVALELAGRTLRAVWDSGAGMTIIDPRFATGLEPAGDSLGVDASGTRMQVPSFWVDDVRIGGVAFARHRVAAVPFGFADAIVGYTTYSQATWVFDFPRRRYACAAQ